MAYRTTKPYTGGIFHVFNRSINSEIIFPEPSDNQRMLTNMAYYKQSDQPVSLSYYLAWCAKNRSPMSLNGEKLVTLISYCLMPTHFHLLLRQESERGISQFLANIQNSYTRFFNSVHGRSGHVFQGQYKLVEINSDELLLHVSRYIHLNPTTAKLIDDKKLDQYEYSSYFEITHDKAKNRIADFSMIIDMRSGNGVEKYTQFVKDNIDYQRKLKLIEKLVFD